jgi:SOS-response transcriptional repressor LexA
LIPVAAEKRKPDGVPKRPKKPPVPNRPEWAAKISELREQLQLNQTAFGQMLQSSAMGVSRWERGAQEPPSHSYIEIGNLAGDPRCWYFWGRAGLRSEDVMKVMPGMQKRLRRAHTHDFEIVSAGSGNKKLTEKLHLVAVPLLKTVAATHGEKGDDVPFLHDAPVESMIAAPKDWCPHPASTSCLRVRGQSMAPTIGDGYIIAVDSSQTDRSRLDGKIVIAWKKDKGLTVSRFRRYDHTETLQPENPRYESITLGHKSDKWKIVARVLWWIGRAP